MSSSFLPIARAALASLLLAACAHDGADTATASHGSTGASGAAGASVGGQAGASSSAGGVAGSPGSAGSAGVGAYPPTDPGDSAPSGDASGRNIQAIRRLYLGDTGWDGSVSAAKDDWKTFGYDVDSLSFPSADSSALHCRPRSGAAQEDVVPDGPHGLDNAFGRAIVPLLSSVSSDVSVWASSSVTLGRFSGVVAIDGLGASAQYHALSAQWLTVTGVDSMGTLASPTEKQWADGSYVWHPFPDQLADPTILDPAHYQSTARTATSYVNGDTWVGGPLGDVLLPISLADGITIYVRVHRAVITLPLAPDRSSATRGMLSGVVSTEELQAEVKAVAASISPSYCDNPSAFLDDPIGRASDMMKDGTQDPGAECDGISIGIGFDTVRATLGEPGQSRPVAMGCGGLARHHEQGDGTNPTSSCASSQSRSDWRNNARAAEVRWANRSSGGADAAATRAARASRGTAELCIRRGASENAMRGLVQG